MSESIPKYEQKKDISFEDAFNQLQGILNILKEYDLTIPPYCTSREKIREDWKQKYAFPIAREGLDGIRAKRMPHGNFRVFFTNGFENPNDPQRIEITKKLQDEGYDVV